MSTGAKDITIKALPLPSPVKVRLDENYLMNISINNLLLSRMNW